MDLHAGVKESVISLLRSNVFRDHVCPTVDSHTLLVRVVKVDSMRADSNIVWCTILDDENQYMRKTIFGVDLVTCQCEQDNQEKDVRVKFSDAQWNLIASKCEDVILLGAVHESGILDVSGFSSAILPAKCNDNDDTIPSEIRILEMFAGGFGGWAHAVRAMAGEGIPIHVGSAIDMDDMACITYMKTHRLNFLAMNAEEAWKYLQEHDMQSMVSSILFRASVQHKWWITFALRVIHECVCFSAPCPAWSTAGASPGLERHDGMIFLVTLTILAVIRPKIWASENVAAIARHRHFKIILDVIQWANYRLVWNVSMDLSDILPHQRDRCLMVAVDLFDRSCSLFKPVKWPAQKHLSLKKCQIIMELSDLIREQTKLTPEELSAYLDPKYMPQSFTGDRRKRTIRDMLQYRMKTVDDIMSCVLTTYGNPFTLDTRLLQERGIFGSLLRTGNKLRKMAIPELLMLLGFLDRTWMPDDNKKAVFMIGNSISVPHALIVLVNVLQIIRADDVIEEPIDLFMRIFKKRVTNENITIKPEEGGIVYEMMSTEYVDCPATQAMFEFHMLRIDTPTQKIQFLCQLDIFLKDMFDAFFHIAEGHSLVFQIEGATNIKLPLGQHIKMPDDNFRLLYDMPLTLKLTEKVIESHDLPVILVLTPQGTMIMQRAECTYVEDVYCAIQNTSLSITAAQSIFDVMGREIIGDKICPNVVFVGRNEHAMNPTAVPFCEYWEFSQDGGIFFANCTPRCCRSVVQWLKDNGIWDFVKSLGWIFWTEADVEEEGNSSKIMLSPHPNSIALGMGSVMSTLIARIFRCYLYSHCHITADGIRVRIKLWDTWVFDEIISRDMKGEFILRAWNLANAWFKRDAPMRLIMRGKYINPDFELTTYESNMNQENNSYPIHMLLQLRGGGKIENAELGIKLKNDIARLLLSLGCELGETSSYVERLMDQAGSTALQSIAKLPTSHLKYEAIQKLSQSLNMKVPGMQQIKNQKKKQTDKRAQKNQLAQSTVYASQYRVQEGFLLNEDGTPCQSCSALRKGASGVALMDSEEAASWTEPGVKLSQDELTLLIIGACANCRRSGKERVSVPVYDDGGKPAVLSCCRHDLGNKTAKIHQPKDIEIEVQSTSIVAITAFHDEMHPEQWQKIIQAPVRATIAELSEMGFPSQLPCPPWGRSWRLGTAKSTPELASSVQYHVRIPEKCLKDALRLSGQKGIYLTPKTDGKVASSDYGVIWMDQPLEQIKVLAASIEGSLGLVKIIKGRASKANWGIRTTKESFSAAFTELKPGATKPNHVVPSCFAKISPTPKGATMEDVAKWINRQGWEAKPIRPLGDSIWLVGFQDKLEETWATWNSQLMLISWLPKKDSKPESALVAGQVPKKSMHSVPNITPEGDAWAAFIAKNGSSGLAVSSTAGQKASTAQQVARMPEGPIEDRFKKHDEQFASMQQAIETLNSRMETTQAEQQQFQSKVQVEFQKVDAGIKAQIQELSRSFGESVEKAMSKQDKQWNASFTSSISELKQLILQRPIPKKKAKVTKPPGSQQEPEEIEDDDES
eukprot:Skav208713  [mRNA]  locus=scaffold42:789146:793777:+ [translate_table: standard]